MPCSLSRHVCRYRLYILPPFLLCLHLFLNALPLPYQLDSFHHVSLLLHEFQNFLCRVAYRKYQTTSVIPISPELSSTPLHSQHTLESSSRCELRTGGPVLSLLLCFLLLPPVPCISSSLVAPLFSLFISTVLFCLCVYVVQVVFLCSFFLS